MIFDEVEKYKEWGHFSFDATTDLATVCNAPVDKIGIFLVYSLKDGDIELLYIGQSGEYSPGGKLSKLTDGIGGLRDSIVNQKHFGEPRHISWKVIVNLEQIEALDIYWYVTQDDRHHDAPGKVAKKLIKIYGQMEGVLPWWNGNDKLRD